MDISWFQKCLPGDGEKVHTQTSWNIWHLPQAPINLDWTAWHFLKQDPTSQRTFVLTWRTIKSQLIECKTLSLVQLEKQKQNNCLLRQWSKPFHSLWMWQTYSNGISNTYDNLRIRRIHTLSQPSIFWNLPAQRKLHSDLLEHCTCLNEGSGACRILFCFVKTQLSVPALETIQLINNLMEVSCLLLSPLTWSLPPLFPEETLTSPPRPHSHRSSSFSLLKLCQKEDRI